jgi:hypothetical protein
MAALRGVDGLGMPENVVLARALASVMAVHGRHTGAGKVNAIHAGACHETDPSPAVDGLLPPGRAGPGADADPTATRSATTVAPQPVVPPPQAARPQPQVLPSPQPAQPIKSTGPAQVAPAPAPKPADKVYDRNGRIVPGCARPVRTACSIRVPAAITTACRPAMGSRSSADLGCQARWQLARCTA